MRFRRFVARSPLLFVTAAVLVSGALGCSVPHTVVPGPNEPAAKAAPAPVESGFLSDYSGLKASEQWATLKFYRDDSRKGGYRKLFFRPVEVWRGSDKRLEDVSEEDLQYMADALYQAIHTQLAKSFDLVSGPGPGVLEIHLAFTLVTNPDQPVDFFSTAVPVRDLSPRTGQLVDGTKRFIRDCALEIEFDDTPAGAAPAKKGERPNRTMRAAFFDARRDGDTPKGNVESWEDVHAVFGKWAALLDERLVALREGTFKPKLTTKQ